MGDSMKFTIGDLIAGLPLPADEKWKDGVWDVEPFAKKGARLVFFAPRGTDFQTAHDEDEFYFIIRGAGEIVIADERYAFEPGNAFFVPSQTPHRFENFTENFATWAVFF
jgi:mannose-6-phosphate isomerase-like protein (cupin superfamily)